MRRKLCLAVILFGEIFGSSAFSTAQTIPPGVGSRQYHAKQMNKVSVASNTAYKQQLNGPKLKAVATTPACDDVDDSNKLDQYGPAKTLALRAVCGLSTDTYTAQQIADGLSFVGLIGDGNGYADAMNAVAAPDSTKPVQAIVKAAINLQPHIENTKCRAVYDPDKKQFEFTFRPYFPTMGASCGDAGVQAFFDVTKTATFGNTVQYLYNPSLGTNQYSSDLITSTFGSGFQLILAGTGTTGTPTASSQSSQGSTSSTSTSTSVPDPVATAVQKLQAGGDFNLRFSFPIVSSSPGTTAWSTYLQPSLGFVLSNTSGQTNSSNSATTGSSTTTTGVSTSGQYLVYLPVESYFQTTSITGNNTNGLTTATLFADVRYGGEIVSPQFQQTLGVQNRVFQLGMASAGVNFAESFRIGGQYYFGGPRQAYEVANTTGQTANVNTEIKGFHIVFTYSPTKKSN